MPEPHKLLDIASAHPQSTHPVFETPAELEEFWQEFYSKVTQQLQDWNAARAQSEEAARTLWLRPDPRSEADELS